MKRATILAVMIASLGLGTGVRPAAGYPVTFEFAGEITYVRDDDGLLGGAVTVGSPFSGLYTFGSSTPDSDPDDGRRGAYDGTLTVVSGDVAGIPFLGPVDGLNYIEIHNGWIRPTVDTYELVGEIYLQGASVDIWINLRDPVGEAFHDDRLPIVPPNLALFESATFTIFDGSEVIPLTIRGDVTALVPETGTVALVGIGMLMLARRGSRRTARQKGTVRSEKKHSGKPLVFVLFASIALGRAIPVTALECNDNCDPDAGECTLTGNDCNDNGVDDAVDIVNQSSEDCNLNRIPDECEFPQCAPIDVVFLFDTSSSMGPPPPQIDQLCDRVDIAIDQLNQPGGLCVRSEIREIFEGGSVACPCCDDDPVNVAYPTTTEGLPEELGSCLPSYGKFEDWGPATAIVAGEKDWSPGKRVTNLW